MAETMLTYRLPNGTHVLIHHAPSEGVPMLLLENGQVTNQPVDSAEIQIDDSNEVDVKHGSILNVVSPLSNTQLIGKPAGNALEILDEFTEVVTWHKCRVCMFTTGQKEELLDHFKTSHMEERLDETTTCEKNVGNGNAGTNEMPVSEHFVFVCGQCGQGFESLEACKEHMMEDHEMIVHEVQENNVEPVQDERSTESNAEPAGSSESIQTENQSSQKELYQDQKKAAFLTCPVRGCRHKFNSTEDRKVHVLCHVDDRPRGFLCCKCQVPFESWKNCSLHLWKAHSIDVGLLTCPVCNEYKCASGVSLESHMRIHRDQRPFSCSDCNKTFKQPSQLRNHRVMHLDPADVPRWYTSKKCNICFKNYADSKCLKKHIKAVHSKLRPYVCQVCGHTSALKSMLQLHLRQHTGEKPHSCSQCDYKTGDHNTLRRHMMRHTGQRSYHCPHCPYSAIQNSAYKKHLRSKHPGKGGFFSCTLCTYKTVNQEHYELHLGDHKNGFIPSTINEVGNGEKVFPGNLAAAQLIYRCLNALSTDGKTLKANVTDSTTSSDGSTQTITIQIPTREPEEDETTQCFLEIRQPEEEEVQVDTGGITIPAEPEHSVT